MNAHQQAGPDGPAPTTPVRTRRIQGRRGAALALVVLTPLVAEFTLGATPLRMAWLLLIYLPIYGAGVLLIRELVRRTGGGWGSVALMGLAYGLVEEGIALQSLTSPHLYGAAHWAPRVLGVNLDYAEANLVYHAVFSVAIPIALVELLYPSRGRRPYLRRRGLVGTALLAVFGVGLLRVSVPPVADAGYRVPLPALLLILALVALLAVLALLVLPRRSTVDVTVRPSAAPRPVLVGVAGGAATLVFLGLLFPFAGARQAAFTHGTWALVPMLAAALLAAVSVRVLRRWSASAGWDRVHQLAAITGALVAHTVFGVGTRTHTPLDTVGLTLVGIVMCVLLGLLSRTLHRARP